MEPQWRFALVGRVMHPYRRRQFREFGAASFIHRPDWIYGPWKISIGSACMILPSIWLSAERQTWHVDGPAIEIGDRVAIRPYCSIVAAESVVIEDCVTLSSFTSVIDNDHTFGDDDSSVLDQPLVTSPVRIGRGSWIGERTTILRGTTIGKQCAIGANSVVRGDIPDYSVAVGVPARVVGSTREGELVSKR